MSARRKKTPREVCALCGGGFKGGQVQCSKTPCVTGEVFHGRCFDRAKAAGFFELEAVAARLDGRGQGDLFLGALK